MEGGGAPGAAAPAASGAAQGSAAESSPAPSSSAQTTSTAPAGEAKPDAGGEKKPTGKEPWKLKVRDREVDFDPSDEERVRAYVQRGIDHEFVTQEATKVRRTAEKLIEGLRGDDPIKMLLNPKLGVDPKKLRMAAEAFLRDQIADEMLSPEERQAIERDRKLQSYEEREAREAHEKKAAAEAEAHQQACREWENKYTAKFKDALAKSGVPPTTEYFSIMAQIQLAANKAKINLSADQIAAQIKTFHARMVDAELDALDDDAFFDRLGQKRQERFRKVDLKRHNQARNADGTFARSGQQPSQNQAPRTPEEKKVMDREAFIAGLRSRA